MEFRQDFRDWHVRCSCSACDHGEYRVPRVAWFSCSASGIFLTGVAGLVGSRETHMQDFLTGLVAGALLCQMGSRRSRRGVDVHAAVIGWFNRRRYARLRIKAEERGFQKMFDEESRYFVHIPFNLQHPADCVRAFQRAQRRHHPASA